jgi:hypothetical protein
VFYITVRDRPLAPRIDARLFLLFSARSDRRDSTTLAYQVVYKGLERKLNIRVDEYDWIDDCHCSEPGRTCHPAPQEPWRTRCYNLLRTEVFDQLLAYCRQDQISFCGVKLIVEQEISHLCAMGAPGMVE